MVSRKVKVCTALGLSYALLLAAFLWLDVTARPAGLGAATHGAEDLKEVAAAAVDKGPVDGGGVDQGGHPQKQEQQQQQDGQQEDKQQQQQQHQQQHQQQEEKGGEAPRPAKKEEAHSRRAEENEILPPDHLNGVKMERDGHLNKDFHQEVFLGKEKEEFEEDSEPRRNRQKLIEIFAKVDKDRDKRISAVELQEWIVEKTREHLQQALDENKPHFRTLDPDGDGLVTWDEYRLRYLVSKGFDEKDIAERIRDKQELKIDEETEELMDNLKERWNQADDAPQDQKLNEKEFLSFQHPEHSRSMLSYMVQEIIHDLDQDKDQRLSLSEFASLPLGTVENQKEQDIDDDWVRERRKEFIEVIDSNKDGFITRSELEEYMDPTSSHNALSEAKQMISVADEDEDAQLSLDEVLRYSEYFTGSKLVDYARNVHEEF
ncbi:45 kDa calcium-binding protein [Lethenteron reissneri]|uniref:45 kDa calcium-binding protein n=1 Tax=Lethenteron reissneri TaxID=7753 RepID=UPI002AB6F252|nr:45 kDa calcium-binding protein [Lethenteron reissneri]